MADITSYYHYVSKISKRCGAKVNVRYANDGGMIIMVNKNKAKKAAYHWCHAPAAVHCRSGRRPCGASGLSYMQIRPCGPHGRRSSRGCPRQAGGSRRGGRGDPPGGSPRGPGAGCPGTPHALSHRTYHRRACCVAHYYRTRKHLMPSAVTAARGSSTPARRSASTTPSASPEKHNSKGQFTVDACVCVNVKVNVTIKV